MRSLSMRAIASDSVSPTRAASARSVRRNGRVRLNASALIRAIKSPAFYFIQKPFDRDVLKTLVERCLELQWRREAHRVHLQHLEDELSQARAFQQSLLPNREATFNGLSVCSQYLPCSGIGGDLYDYASAEPGQTALLVADVSGHGLQAAMMTSVGKECVPRCRLGMPEKLVRLAQRVAERILRFADVLQVPLQAIEKLERR
jgi:hypothetical protein